MSTPAVTTGGFFVNTDIQPGTQVQSNQRYQGMSLRLTSAEGLRLAVRDRHGNHIATNVTQADLRKLTLSKAQSSGSEVLNITRDILSQAGFARAPLELQPRLSDLVVNDEHSFIFDQTPSSRSSDQITVVNGLLQDLKIDAGPLGYSEKIELLRALIRGDIRPDLARNLAETPALIMPFFEMKAASAEDIQHLIHPAFGTEKARANLLTIHKHQPQLARHLIDLAKGWPASLPLTMLHDLAEIITDHRVDRPSPFPVAVPLLFQARLVAKGNEDAATLAGLLQHMKDHGDIAIGLGKVAEVDLSMALTLGRLKASAPNEVGRILEVWAQADQWYSADTESMNHAASELRQIAARMTSFLRLGLLSAEDGDLFGDLAKAASSYEIGDYDPEWGFVFGDLATCDQKIATRLMEQVKGALQRGAAKAQAQGSFGGKLGPQAARDYLALELAPILINENGRLDQAMANLAAKHLTTSRSPAILEMSHLLKSLVESPKLRGALEAIQLGADNESGQELVRAHFGMAPGQAISSVDARRAALSAMLSGLRQHGVGSCFSSSVALMVKESQPVQMLRDFGEMLATGSLVYQGKGREEPIQVAMASNVGDHNLKTPIRLDSNGVMRGRLSNKSERWIDLTENQSIGDFPPLQRAFKAAGLGDHTQLVLQGIEHLWENQGADLSFADILKAAIVQIGKHQPNTRGFEQAMARGSQAFNGAQENLLQKTWEFTLGSLAEADTHSKLATRLFDALWDGASTEIGGTGKGLSKWVETALSKAGETQKLQLLFQFQKQLREVVKERFNYVFDADIAVGQVAADGHSRRGGFRLQIRPSSGSNWQSMTDNLEFSQALSIVLGETMNRVFGSSARELGPINPQIRADLQQQLELVVSNGTLVDDAIRSIANHSDQSWPAEPLPSLDEIRALPWQVRTGHSLASVLENYFGGRITISRLPGRKGANLLMELMKVMVRHSALNTHLPMGKPGHAFRMALNQPRLQGITQKRGLLAFNPNAASAWLQATAIDGALAAEMIAKSKVVIDMPGFQQSLVGLSVGEARNQILEQAGVQGLNQARGRLDKFLFQTLPIPIQSHQWSEIAQGLKGHWPELGETQILRAKQLLTPLFNAEVPLPQEVVLAAIAAVVEGGNKAEAGQAFLEQVALLFKDARQWNQALSAEDAQIEIGQTLAKFEDLEPQDREQMITQLTAYSGHRSGDSLMRGLMSMLSERLRSGLQEPPPGTAKLLGELARNSSIIRFADSNWQATDTPPTHDGRKYFAFVPNPGSGELEVWHVLSNDTVLKAPNQESLFRHAWRVADQPQEFRRGADRVGTGQGLVVIHESPAWQNQGRYDYDNKAFALDQKQQSISALGWGELEYKGMAREPFRTGAAAASRSSQNFDNEPFPGFGDWPEPALDHESMAQTPASRGTGRNIPSVVITPPTDNLDDFDDFQSAETAVPLSEPLNWDWDTSDEPVPSATTTGVPLSQSSRQSQSTHQPTTTPQGDS